MRAAQDADDDDKRTTVSKKRGEKGEKEGKKEKDEKDEKERVETENIFGFTEGSDTGEKGERGLTLEALWRKGTIFSPYSALLGRLNFEYSLRDDLKVGASISYDLYHFPSSTILELKDEFGIFSGDSRAMGLSGEVKYGLLDRDKNPVGLAVSLEPEWRSVVAGQGSGINLIQFQTKAMADTVLVPERIFAALNASWEPQVTWTNTGETIRDTNVEISAALTGQLFEGLFAGGEVRYLAGFEGLSFARANNSGIFIGPTLYAKLSKRAFVAASWSIRVGGAIRERDPLPDFGNVPDATESHHVRFRAGVTF